MSKRAAPRLYVDNTQRWILIWAVSGLIAIGAGAVPAFADGPVPLGPAPKEPPGIPFVIETAVLGPVIRPGDMGDALTAFDGARPMGPFTWGNPDTYWCGVDLDCGGGDQDRPAPVPLPASVWLMIFATAALVVMRRRA